MAHVKRIFAVTKSEFGVEEEDRTMWIDMYRIDQFTFIPEDGKKFLVYLKWQDEPTDPTQSTQESEANLAIYGREIITKRLTDPQSDLGDNEHPDFWFNVHVVNSVRIVNPQGQLYKLQFFNENPELIALLKNELPNEEDRLARRKIWIRRVVHWDTDDYPDEENVYVPALEYQRKGDTDEDQYIDQEIPQVAHIIETTEPIAQRFTSIMSNFDMAKNFRNKTLEEIKTERQGKLPPIRLDPFQQIINCKTHVIDRAEDVTAFHIWNFSETYNNPPGAVQVISDHFERAYITEDNTKDRDDGSRIKYVHSNDFPVHNEQYFKDLGYKKLDLERGLLLTGYIDDSNDSWRLYYYDTSVDWYKNNVYHHSIHAIGVITYIKKVNKEAKEKLGLSTEQAENSFYLTADGGTYVFRIRTTVAEDPIKSIEPWTSLGGTGPLDDSVRLKSHSSDYEGNGFVILDLFNSGASLPKVYSWNKWGTMRWNVIPIEETAPVLDWVLVGTGSVTYTIVANHGGIGISGGVATVSDSTCIGLCYVFWCIKPVSTFLGDGSENVQSGPDGGFPYEVHLIGVGPDGTTVLDEKLGTAYKVFNVNPPNENTDVRVGTDMQGSYNTYNRFYPTDTTVSPFIP